MGEGFNNLHEIDPIPASEAISGPKSGNERRGGAHRRAPEADDRLRSGCRNAHPPALR